MATYSTKVIKQRRLIIGLLATAAIGASSLRAEVDVFNGAQEVFTYEHCTWQPPPGTEYRGFLNESARKTSSFDRTPDSVHRIVTRFHIVRRGDGSGGFDEELIPAMMRDLNYGFRNTPFVFAREPGIVYIDNDTFYNDFPTFSSAFDMLRENAQPGVMNWYITPNIAGAVAGTWIAPASPVRGILMAYSTTGTPSNIVTPTHEMAHIFQVIHPFESVFGIECTDGSNCIQAGDLVCDTPASPRVFQANTTATGIYFANQPGPCANDPPYDPNPRLYMDVGWAPGHILRNEFSQGEMNRAVSFLTPNTALNVADLVGPDRPDILVDCDGNDVDDIDEILRGEKTDLGNDLDPDVCQTFPRSGDLIVSGMNPGPNNRLRYYDRGSGEWRGDLWNGMSFVHQVRPGPDGLIYIPRLTIIQRVSLATGRTVDNFIDGVLEGAGTFVDLLFEPSGDILALDNISQNVRRYDGATGQFLGVFIDLAFIGNFAPKYMEYGPDGNIYIVGNGAEGNSVERFDAVTGQSMGAFVSAGSGGLITGQGLVFHTDGFLYVSNGAANTVLRYDGATGEFDREFVTAAGNGGLANPHSLRFGPDGSLYVASRASHSVKRYNGSTGAFLGDFVQPGSGGSPGTGGLNQPAGLAFASTGANLNAGHNGAWFNPEAPGQGFMIEVLPESSLVFLAWFTYDLVDSNKGTIVGDSGHRWLTALGPIEGGSAMLDIVLTTGGIFDDSTPVSNSDAGSYGSIELNFSSCSQGTIRYDLSAAGLAGEIPISRIASDNVALCEQMSR